MTVRPAKTQISLGIRSVWSESSLSAWRKLGSLATHEAHSKDWSDWADAAHIPYHHNPYTLKKDLFKGWDGINVLISVALMKVLPDP